MPQSVAYDYWKELEDGCLTPLRRAELEAARGRMEAMRFAAEVREQDKAEAKEWFKARKENRRKPSKIA